MYSAGKSKFIVAREQMFARDLAPFHSRNEFPHRTIFGFFPEFASWFKLDTSTDYSGDRETFNFGYCIPIAVFFFHRLPKMPIMKVALPGSSSSSISSPIKNKTRVEKSDSKILEPVDEEDGLPNPALRPDNPN